MIDTIVIECHKIDNQSAKILKDSAIIKSAKDVKNDTIIYEFTNCKLDGTFDSRISIQVRSERWERSIFSFIPIKVQCDPYVRIECSLHKFLFGTNVVGGTESLQMGVYLLLKYVQNVFSISLPSLKDWYVLRIDYSKNYYMDKKSKISYFAGLNLSAYPRRNEKINKYGKSGIMVTGGTTTLKVYDKYYDYLKHDKKRLKKLPLLDSTLIDVLQEIASNVIRFEVEVKLKKLKYDFNRDYISIFDISKDYLEKVYYGEVEKLLKLSKEGQDMYSRHDDVLNVLKSNFTSQRANNLYAFWLQVATLGEEHVKSNYSSSTFYRNRKDLKDLNISMLNTNVTIDKLETINFKPSKKFEYNNFDIDYLKRFNITYLYNKFVRIAS